VDESQAVAPCLIVDSAVLGDNSGNIQKSIKSETDMLWCTISFLLYQRFVFFQIYIRNVFCKYFDISRFFVLCHIFIAHLYGKCLLYKCQNSDPQLGGFLSAGIYPQKSDINSHFLFPQ
jgi:hypothetical protein